MTKCFTNTATGFVSTRSCFYTTKMETTAINSQTAATAPTLRMGKV